MKNNLEKKRTLTPQQVEEVFGIPIGSLANMRCQKHGPKYYILPNGHRKGRKILYFIDDIESWIRTNPVNTLDSLDKN